MTRALCVFVVLFVTSWPASADNAKPLTTILLIARADLPDSNFKDAVVLVMNNVAPAPAGVIINRPTRIAVSRLFPDLERLARLDDKVYFGGPVEIASMSFLFRADTLPEYATQVLDGVYFSTNRELLRKLLGREKPMEGLRIFIGHSGWAPGQLEAEIARGDWTLAPAETSAIFDGKSEHPWPERQMPDVVHRTSRPSLHSGYSMRSSVRNSSDSGMICPSALAGKAAPLHHIPTLPNPDGDRRLRTSNALGCHTTRGT